MFASELRDFWTATIITNNDHGHSFTSSRIMYSRMQGIIIFAKNDDNIITVAVVGVEYSFLIRTKSERRL